jgi:hypothetical protein
MVEQTTCPDCAQPLSECSDPDREWFPQRRICYATMEREAAVARYGALHEDRPFHDGTFTKWSEERSSRYPYHSGDGVTIYATGKDAAPWDEFTSVESASPVQSVAEKAPCEQPQAPDGADDRGDSGGDG